MREPLLLFYYHPIMRPSTQRIPYSIVSKNGLSIAFKGSSQIDIQAHKIEDNIFPA